MLINTYMNSFKEYISKQETHSLESARRIMSAYSKNIETNQTDIDIVLKGSPICSKISANQAIKYDKKIPVNL